MRPRSLPRPKTQRRRDGGQPVGHRYFRDELDGGLRVITVEAPHLHTALLAFYVRTGSRHETPANNGVSHFLEHMFFRGSKRHPDTVRMNALVEGVGGNLNGITTRDHGFYYTPIHPDHLGVGADVLGDMLTRPVMRHLETEREIILEEMLDEVDERGRDVDIDNLSKMELFGAHPLALKIAGTRESVLGLTRRQLDEHFRRHYVSGNLVFAAAGRVRRDEVLALANKHFRHFPRGQATVDVPPWPGHAGPRLRFVERDESQTEIRLSFWTVPEQHPDFAALQLIRRILDDGLSSRLPHRVVERRGLAYSVHASIETFHDVGLFELDAASAPRKMGEVVAEMCRTLHSLAERKVTDEELARAKRRHRMLLEFAQDSPSDLAAWFGGTELFRPPETFEERCQAIDAQTAESLRGVARRTFSRENLCAIAVGPKTGIRAVEHAVQNAL